MKSFELVRSFWIVARILCEWQRRTANGERLRTYKCDLIWFLLSKSLFSVALQCSSRQNKIVLVACVGGCFFFCFIGISFSCYRCDLQSLCRMDRLYAKRWKMLSVFNYRKRYGRKKRTRTQKTEHSANWYGEVPFRFTFSTNYGEMEKLFLSLHFSLRAITFIVKHMSARVFVQKVQSRLKYWGKSRR